jgi:MFS family permease
VTASTEVRQRVPREVWILVVGAFVIAIGYGIVAPVIPVFATSFQVSVTAASFVISAFALARLISAPGAGRLIARLGERRIYVWGVLIVAVSTGACAFASTYWQLLVFRAVGGFGSAMFTVSAVALLVRVSPPELRGQVSGLWATGFLTGGIVGPLVGGLLVRFSVAVPFMVYAIGLVLAAAIAWIFLRESPEAIDPTGNGEPVDVRTALRHRAYRAALVSNFANGWAVFGVRVSLIPLFVTAVLHRDATFAGMSLSVFAVANVAVLMAAGRAADRIGRKPVIIVSAVVSAVGMIVLAVADSATVFVVASAVTGIGSGLLGPPQTAAVADVIGNRSSGGPALAGFQMAGDLGAIVGPLLAGAIVDAVSYQAAFLLTGVVFGLGALVWFFAPETLPRRPPERTAADLAVDGAVQLDPDLPAGTRVRRSDQ